MVILACSFSVAISAPVYATIPTTHTVTFVENDSGSDSVTSFETGSSAQNLTLFANLSPSFSNPGYTFAGWNTAANGSGGAYSDGASYNFSADIELFAQWVAIPITHTVTFAENDNGSDSVSAFETGTSSKNLTLFANLSPSFSNPGYTFAGWNTSANGGGTTYSDGANFSFNSDLELFAQWNATSATATFVVNGGTGSDSPQTVAIGGSITLPSSTGLTDSGFYFSGWNTAANGSGTSYQAGASVTLSSNETFYAQWTPAIQISFGDNGGVGTLSSLSGQLGTTVTLPSSTSLTNTGFTLTSWNTLANGLGTSYTPGQSLTLSTSLTLYAQWTAIPSIEVSFSANGGSGSLATLTGASGTTVTLPSASSVVRTGYTLTAWNTAANGSGTSYSPGQSLSLSSTLTLYAQWKATPTSTLYGSIGLFPKSTTTLSAGLKAQVARLAAVVKRKGYNEVTLFGYSADTGLASLDGSLSSTRATRVATYLQSELRAMHVTGVKISATGEGAVVGKTSSSYSTVEVFVQ